PGQERRRLRDLLCGWPTDAAGSTLLSLELQPPERDRAAMILILRFGQSATSWAGWLRAQETNRQLRADVVRTLARKRPLPMLLLWYSRQPDADPAALGLMEKE